MVAGRGMAGGKLSNVGLRLEINEEGLGDIGVNTIDTKEGLNSRINNLAAGVFFLTKFSDERKVAAEGGREEGVAFNEPLIGSIEATFVVADEVEVAKDE